MSWVRVINQSFVNTLPPICSHAQSADKSTHSMRSAHSNNRSMHKGSDASTHSSNRSAVTSSESTTPIGTPTEQSGFSLGAAFFGSKSLFGGSRNNLDSSTHSTNSASGFAPAPGVAGSFKTNNGYAQNGFNNGYAQNGFAGAGRAPVPSPPGMQGGYPYTG
jgi:hypothetical protein